MPRSDILATFDELSSFCETIVLPQHLGFLRVQAGKALSGEDRCSVSTGVYAPDADRPCRCADVEHEHRIMIDAPVIRVQLPISRSDLIRRVRASAIDVLTHELDEWFTVGNARPFDPHKELF